jgi:hypothetical protein
MKTSLIDQHGILRTRKCRMSVQVSTVSHIFNKCAAVQERAIHQPAQHSLPTLLHPALELSASSSSRLPLLAGELQAAGFWYLTGTSLSALGQLRGGGGSVVPRSGSAPNAPKGSGLRSRRSLKLLFTSPALDRELQQPQRICAARCHD